MNLDRRDRIVNALSASLDRRRETLDRLADAAGAFEQAKTAFAGAYKDALSAGWSAKELAAAGVTPPDKPARQRRARNPRPQPGAKPTDAANHE